MSAGRGHAAEWSLFWSADGAGKGCLPNASAGVGSAQAGFWAEFIRPLRRGARLLDLGTGDGVVLAGMRALRPDLKLLGVDSSFDLGKAPKGVTLKAGVAMERLPFADASFDAIASQFGYEYGDTARTAPEVGRVLRPGGALGLILHDAEGPVVTHNIGRAEALRWALDRLIAKARALIAARRIAPIPTPPHFAEAPAEARRLFPDQSAGQEFALAVLQTLERSRTTADALGVIDTLEARGRGELGRIEALRAAALSRAKLDAIVDQLTGAGVEIDPPGQLRAGAAEPAFAWTLRGRKSR